MTETKPCLHCGKTMTRQYYDAGQKWANRKACSRACGYKIRGKIAKEAADAKAIRDAETTASWLRRMRASAESQRRRQAVRMP